MDKVKLAEFHQKEFGTSLTNNVTAKTGPDHNPTITVAYFTKWGEFTKTGNPGENKKILFEQLAEEILQKIQ